LGSLGQMNIL